MTSFLLLFMTDYFLFVYKLILFVKNAHINVYRNNLVALVRVLHILRDM